MPARFFLPELPTAGAAAVDGELAHHLVHVLRARPGDPVRLADGRGGTADAVVTAVERRVVHLQVDPARRRPAPARRVHVAFAPPRATRAEWLFEHGTEVGIDVFHPLWTARTRPQGERLERWLRLVRAAAGQCDRDWLPEVRPVRELAAFLADPDLPAARFVAAPGSPALAGLAPASGDVVVLVGPEGGLAAAELAAAQAGGFRPAGLGPHVLRTETAALVAAALLQGGAAAPPAR
ncbi:MAG: 16S rRNA (uracil(1498)-N(3))-methyltransferase [Planctomycetes bacterium]|nr:16S rRNA (uracil(1498)-N(3))-methyltransferase [Planctomycetota bacterium]